jgi:hypothetical protein
VEYAQERLSFATSEREIRTGGEPLDKKYSGFIALFARLPRMAMLVMVTGYSRGGDGQLKPRLTLYPGQGRGSGKVEYFYDAGQR